VSRVLTLRPEAGDVRIARDFCIAELAVRLTGALAGTPDAAELLDDLLDAAAMITSELVTNAIRAGASSIELALHDDARAVRIAVTDDAHGTVAMASPGPLEPNGRGLRIVAGLADDWGVDPASVGKTVWAALNLPVTGPVSQFPSKATAS
jgi:hypothetical protein